MRQTLLRHLAIKISHEGTAAAGTKRFRNLRARASPVPEPSTWAMMILGFASLGFLGYRRCSLKARLSIAALLLAIVTFPALQARADVVLSFNATYDSRVVFDGPNATTDPNFKPFSFSSFSVSFDPTVTSTLGPTFSTGMRIYSTRWNIWYNC